MNSQLLVLEHIEARVKDKQILFDCSCVFEKGKISVIMGPNGSGKSTLAHVIMGDPRYSSVVTKGVPVSTIRLHGKNIYDLPTEEKARLGLFLSFQSPIAISGVSVKDLLRSAMSHQSSEKMKSISALMSDIVRVSKMLRIDEHLLNRSIHEEFSGGERKKIELLQALIMKPEFAIFDEIDTGVDVDALKLIALGIAQLQKQGTGIILITHNERMLKYVDVDQVVIMTNGRIVKVGSNKLIDQVNAKGYTDFS